MKANLEGTSHLLIQTSSTYMPKYALCLIDCFTMVHDLIVAIKSPEKFKNVVGAKGPSGGLIEALTVFMGPRVWYHINKIWIC